MRVRDSISPISKLPDEVLTLIIKDIIDNGNFVDVESLLWTNRRFRSLLYKIISQRDRLIIKAYSNKLKDKNKEERKPHFLGTASEKEWVRECRRNSFTIFFQEFFNQRIHYMSLQLASIIAKVFLKFAPKFYINIDISLEKQNIENKDWIVAEYDIKAESLKILNDRKSWEQNAKPLTHALRIPLIQNP